MNCFEDSQGALRFTFPTQVDALVCDEIGPEIEKKVADAEGQVVFDLKDVALVTSSFFRLCIAAVKTTGQERFRLTNVDPRVKKTFMIARLNKLMTIE